MPFKIDTVRAMHKAYRLGDSLATIGGRYDISHETVRQLFIEHGLERLSLAQRAAQGRAEMQEKVESQRYEIVRLYKREGTIDAVVNRLKLPRRLVAQIINQIPNRESYRRKGTRETYSQDELIDHLHKAAKHAGEPLSGMTYQDVAPGMGLAAYNTQVRHFGSFAEALEAAGIQGNPPRGRRANSVTAEQCIDAVARCITAHGGKVSYRTYLAWASGQPDTPSGPTVRNVVGWNEAVREALDRYAQSVR